VAGSTVLVVEDEPRIVEFLVENLRADDYSVLTAGTAEEAIELLAQSQPDLMLLDVVLPGMSGIDLCRRVRGGDGVNEPWDPDLPIIMLSAKAEHTDRVRGLSRGADDYVTKVMTSLCCSTSGARSRSSTTLPSASTTPERNTCGLIRGRSE
jgi:DNA-binding response OmpR family regulator